MERQRQLAVVQDFVATLPPAVTQLLQVVYDSNTELTEHLERRSREIQRLSAAHAAAMQQKDQELEGLRALLRQMQQAVQQRQPPAHLDQLLGMHAMMAEQDGGSMRPAGAASAKRRRSGDFEDGAAGLQEASTAAANAPQHMRANMAEQHAAAARSHSAGGLAPATRAMKPLQPGKLTLAGVASPPLFQQQQQQQQQHHQQQPPASTPISTQHSKAAADAPSSHPAQQGLQAAAAAGTPAHPMQTPAHMRTSAASASPAPAAEQDAADMLQFLATSQPNMQSAQPERSHQALSRPAQNVQQQFPAEFDTEHALATVLSYLKEHGTGGASSARGAAAAAARGPSSAGGGVGSDGGSAATGFNPAGPLPGAQYHNQLHFTHAAPSSHHMQAAAAAALAAPPSMEFGFAAPGGPTAQGFGLQHMMGALSYGAPQSQALLSAPAAAGPGFFAGSTQGFVPPAPGAAAAAGTAAAAGAGYNYSTGWEGRQMAGMQGSVGAAAAAGMGLLPEMAPANPRCGSASSIGRRSSEDGGQADSNGDSKWHREVDRLVPEHVQDAIRVDWGSRPQPRELQVTCNGHAATFFVNPETNECCIRTAAGSVVKPTIFERDCGKAHCKDWQRSIRVPGYQGKNGPIRLGHFVRIVGISTSRRVSSA